MKEILHKAMSHLASVCDGANSEDGAGFAKGDSYNGKYLAEIPLSDWDNDSIDLATSYAIKYRKQIAHILGDVVLKDSRDYYIRERVSEKRRKAYNKKVASKGISYIENGLIYTDTPYDANFVADSKKIKTRRYVGGTINSYRMESIKEVLELCTKYDVDVQFDTDIKISVPVNPEAIKIVEELKSPARTVAIEKGSIIINFPYAADIVAAVKETKVARYSKEPTPHWYAGSNFAYQIYNALNGKDFHFDDSFLSLVNQSVSNKTSYSNADTEFCPEVLAIRPEYKVLPHQWVPIEKIVKNLALLDADSQGLGKTFVALTAAVIKKSKRIVVVAPSSLTGNWDNESQMFYVDGTFKVFHAEGRTVSSIPDDVNLVILGWPNLSFWLDIINNWNADMIIVDEAHYGKSGSTSLRGKAYIDLGKKNKKATKVALTGTPILNRPLELLASLIFFGIEKNFGGVAKFKDRYCDPTDILAPKGVKTYKKNARGEGIITLYNGASNLEELHDILTSTGVYIRRTKKLLIEQGLLGHKYVNGVEFFDYESKRTPTYISLNATERAEYEKIEQDFQDGLNEKLEILAAEMGLHPSHPKVRNAISSNKSGEALMLLGEFRRKIGQLKVRAVKEFIANLVAKGERVVVFAHHKDVVDSYANEYSGIKIQGGMGVKKVGEVKRKFNTLPFEQHPVLSVSIEAGKTGHTLCLQKKNGVGNECAYAIFAEEPYVYGDAEQAEDRIYRIGQGRDVYIINLLVKNTIDEMVYSIREKKRAIFNAVIDGVSLEDDEDEDNIARSIIREYL